MAHNSTAPHWIAATLLTAILAAAAWTSFSNSGLRLETGDIELVMKASFDHGLTVEFLNPKQPR